VTESGLTAFQEQRQRLFGIAYRMLGSATEAEDVLQDAWLRWQSADRAAVADAGAFLARTVTNLCLNELQSARARREIYVGEWLPEPVLTGAGVLGPLESAEQRDAVSFALLSLLERLSPQERAAWVLHEAFRYSHREVADTLSISETSARQLVTRARKGLAARPRRAVDPAQWSEFVERFLRAARDGELQELEQLLSPQAMAVSDGGGIVSAARFPIVGRQKVARFVAGLLAKYSDGLSGVFAEANGELALIAQGSEGISAVWFIEFDAGLVTALRMVRNPHKLAFLAEQLSQNGGLSGLS
jgi:RNA polymerase sigma factor (sigma-70 family)